MHRGVGRYEKVRGKVEVRAYQLGRSQVGAFGPSISRGVRGHAPPENFYDIDSQRRILSHSWPPENSISI